MTEKHVEEIGALREDQKEKEMEIQELKAENKRLKLRNLDESRYGQWNSEEITAWIMGLGDGRFLKYAMELGQNLKEEQVDGTTIGDADAADLKRWGVARFADIKFLQKQIEILVCNDAPHSAFESVAPVAQMENEGSNAEPTAYH